MDDQLLRLWFDGPVYAKQAVNPMTFFLKIFFIINKG